jgi:hypothetical protein
MTKQDQALYAPVLVLCKNCLKIFAPLSVGVLYGMAH